jgi:hypothetical protein
VVGVLALAVAFAWPIQGGGGVQNAHYALVKALASGTAEIEGVLGELGDFATEDYAVHEGRKYANKAPGFAALAVPPYLVLRALGVRTTGDPGRMLWALGLFVVVAPALCLLALVRDRGDAVASGFGTAVAVVLGGATFVLPYATVFLPHVLAATLLFAAFVVLWRTRAQPLRVLPVATAGFLAGFGVTTEYPIAIGAALLFLYALAGSDPVRRGLAFAAGGAFGVLPLLLYNAWAFGNPLHNSYSGVAQAGLGEQFGAPSARVLLELLLSANGLLVLSPVLACAAAGVVLLERQGQRAEAVLVAAVTVSYLVFNSLYFSPFGGSWPGTRYLIAILPFLAVALTPALRAWPATCGALATVSALVLLLVTSTHALAAADGRWLDRLADRELTLAATSVVGVTGWYAIAPLAVAVAVAGVAAFASIPPLRVRSSDTLLAGAAVAGWAAAAAAAPRGADAADYGSYVAPALVLGGFAGLLVALRAYAFRVPAKRPASESP